MARRQFPRHARPSGRSETAAAYQAALAELVSVRSARWNDQLEVVRLTALTEQLAAQVQTLQADLATTTHELAALRAQPPRTVEVPVVIRVPAEPLAPTAATAATVAPATPAAPAAGPTAREDLLLLEMAELRRLVAHQQQLLADLTVRLLDLLARFLPSAPAAPAAPPVPGTPGTAGTAPPGSGPVPPADAVLDDETATRLRVIREAFGR